MRGNKLLIIIAVIVFLSGVIPISTQHVNAAMTNKVDNIFKDLPNNHWAMDAINWGYNAGIVKGDANGNFNPNSNVTEPEFLAMIARAYSEDFTVRKAESGEKWYIPYFDLATDNFWHFSGQNSVYQRYQVANIVYSMLQGSYKNDAASIQFLLDTKLSTGKISATVEGYSPYENLNRAEAIVFIKRMKQLYPSVKEYVGASVSYSSGLRDISIGDTEATLTSKLGTPNRKDSSEFNFTWYVYNKDYNRFVMYGVSSEKKVVALYSNSRNVWGKDNAILVGSSIQRLKKFVGNEVKVNTIGYYQNKQNGITTNYYLDKFSDNVVDGILQYDAIYSKKGTATQELIDKSYELQILDVTNVFRNKNNVQTMLTWNEKAAKAAYLHSKEMYTNKYLDHTNLAGLDPQARLKAAGLTNFGGGENIASGYENAFAVYTGWINSWNHRDNMLYSEYKELGVGAYRNYYTQDFIMPY
ncbi:MAG: CAP-associated domain-containing protein [Candidatus Pristimantibacillus lignocellulolyticus]|uniref:CAP-associated domain-containing protein n=1 Tax=Candidatus Pristimantibacillus lignocellulolyticus TaxID=2994561 RepID=A0A9J6ZBL7_9BACL|nr:MAG: CAP-associated domain-containing protein [Candidatus Pristimantibacillus lignocellulolyticus]